MSDAIQNQFVQFPSIQNQAQLLNHKIAQNLSSDFQKASAAKENEALAPFDAVLEDGGESENDKMLVAAMTSVIEQQLASILFDIASGSGLESSFSNDSGFSVFGDDDENIDDF